jgi:hypothetical protein
MLPEVEPYNEQVILLGGQGIFYSRPQALTLAPPQGSPQAANMLTSELSGITADSGAFIYFCPQSVFKIHPLYDQVIKQILLRTPDNVHVVVTGGRKSAWTAVYKRRLMEALGGANSTLAARFHVIPRVSSQYFVELIHAVADVVLHPFPFDGSRVSADTLTQIHASTHAANSIPYVTLPSEYLRGRMGKTYMRTMNIPQLVAHSIDEYVAIAVRLSADKEFYSRMQQLLAERSELVWEDMEVVYEWTLFLSRVTGVTYPHNRRLTFEEFLQLQNNNTQTVADVEAEVARHARRRHNRREFDRVWGKEDYLLDAGTKLVILESTQDLLTFDNATMSVQAYVPRIFTNWRRSKKPISVHTLTDGKSARQEQLQLSTNSIWNRGRHKRVNVNGQLPTTKKVNFVRATISADTTAPTHPLAATLPHAHTVNPQSSRSVASPELLAALKHVRYLLQTTPVNAPTSPLDIGYAFLSPYEEAFDGELLFHLEFGSLQYFRGSYESAYKHCSLVTEVMDREYAKMRASRMQQEQQEDNRLGLAYVCVGASAVYMRYADIAIHALETARDVCTYSPINCELIVDTEYTTLRSAMFGVTLGAVEFNLLTTYVTFDRLHECLRYGLSILKLPPMAALEQPQQTVKRDGMFVSDDSSILILGLAPINWTNPQSQQAIKDMETEWKLAGRIRNPDLDVWNHVHRIQSDHHALLTSITTCATATGLIDMAAMHRVVVGQYYDGIHEWYLRKFMGEAVADVTTRKQYKRSGTVLITQHFQTQDDLLKQTLQHALDRNLANPAISEIVLLNEHTTLNQEYYSKFSNYSHLLWKLTIVPIHKRMSFRDAFEFANKNLMGRTVIIGDQT